MRDALIPHSNFQQLITFSCLNYLCADSFNTCVFCSQVVWGHKLEGNLLSQFSYPHMIVTYFTLLIFWTLACIDTHTHTCTHLYTLMDAHMSRYKYTPTLSETVCSEILKHAIRDEISRWDKPQQLTAVKEAILVLRY